ncbi:metallophosphoesterase [Paenibacillus sp. N3.4]|uniref:metallophosphoesterase n=1 Tax=Paenibacillus sp. N3.4 TaxID=2603222 RepID=UPI0011CB0529|nr:metallophosphoesterase [Paenibacillus sp. N3.4]TXK85445.1 metallophosphoesterase [Paenibacillus sp. N3.4]
MQSPPPLSRRSFLKKGTVLAGSFLAATGALGSYANFVEPKWYDITRHTLIFERLPNAFHGIKVVHFSDLHIGYHFDLKDLEHVVNIIRKEKADILCFTGDLFDAEITTDPDQTSQLLASLEAPLGKWSVLGNHDKWIGENRTVAILQKGGFQTLLNSFKAITYLNQVIQLAGVEDLLTGKPDISKALDGANPHRFTLLLSHCPNYADQAAKYPVDLQLSGHTHGGQIRLPFLGAVITPPGGDNYVEGLHPVTESKMLIYTNRGIGTTTLPFRFLCRPEITVFTLEKRNPKRSRSVSGFPFLGSDM